MNPVPELVPLLKQLRLSGILDSLEARNRQAIEGKLAYTEFLSLLIQDEVAPLPPSKREYRRLDTDIVQIQARAYDFASYIERPSNVAARLSTF